VPADWERHTDPVELEAAAAAAAQDLNRHLDERRPATAPTAEKSARKFVNVGIRVEMLERLKARAAQEDRPLSTLILRYPRQGLASDG
jgi:hypothetical protein